MKYRYVPVGDLAKIVGGGTPSKKVPDYFVGDIPWVTPKDVKNWEIKDSIDHISEKAVKNSATKIIPSFSVLTVIRSGVLKHTFPVAINTKPVTLNQDMKAFICSEKLYPQYLARFFKAKEREILSNIRGTTADNLPLDLLKSIQIPLPPLDEQRRIAAILDKADGVRRKRREAIRLTEELLRSQFLEMFGDPVTNPKGWEVITIKDIVSEIKDGPHVSPKYSDSHDAIPILSTRNVRPGRLIMDDVKFVSKETYQELVRRFRPQYGDVLLTKGGTTGYAKAVDWKWDFAIWVHLAALRPTERIRPAFLEAVLNTPNCYAQSQRYTHGIANRDLGLTRIKKIQLSLPPLDLQDQYCAFRQRVLRKMEYQVQCSESTDNLFNSLLQRAFRGGL